MNNLKPNYRILVLYNPENEKATSLLTGVALAKRINGAVDLLSVSSIKKLNNQPNQVALIRSFKEDKAELKSHLSKVGEELIDKEDVPLIFNSKVGLVREVIESHIRLTKPDIVILGNSKSLRKKLQSSSILKIVIDNHKGITLLSNSNSSLDEKLPLAFGSIDYLSQKHPFIKSLSKNSKQPFKLFQFSAESPTEDFKPQKDIVVYNFEDRAKMFSNFLRYIEQSNINLLCIQKTLLSFKTFQPQIKKEIINKLTNLETPILVFP